MEDCPCTGGGGCDPGLQCSEAQICVPTSDPSVGSTTTTSEPGDTGTSEASSSGEGDDATTMSGPECSDPGSPEESKDCLMLGPNRPFCGEDQVCAACVDDDQCSAATLTVRPICQTTGENAGACVECNRADAVEADQCPADMPHCNLDTFECEGCLEHSECPGTACEVGARKCFPDDRVLYVRRGPTNQYPCTFNVPGGGGPDNPYCDVEQAIEHAQFFGKTSGWTFVFMYSDSNEHHGSFTIPGGGDFPLSYAIVHQDGGPLDKHTRFTAFGPVVTVTAGVNLYLVGFGVYVEPNAFADPHLGIDCLANASLWLDDSRVIDSRGPGIRADNCEIHMRRSSIAFGKTEGIDMKGGSLHMVNSFIDANGSNKDLGGGGIHMSAGAVADILYSTLVGNINEPLKGGDTVDCDGSVTLKIRNSVFAHGPDTGNSSIMCEEGDILVTDSVVDGEFGPDTGNFKQASEDILEALYIDSVTGSARILDPVNAELFAGKAIWRAGDPHDDCDRQPRKLTPEMTDYAGADYYVE